MVVKFGKPIVKPGGWGGDDYESDEGEAFLLEAFSNKEKIGYVKYNLTDDLVHIRWLEVLPKYRRKGVGLALLDELDRRYDREIDTGGFTDEGEPLWYKWVGLRGKGYRRGNYY
jgi:Acetyltransferase (GNAT) family.